ncbi:hypothetical protein KR032_005703 [Drosophila birchii]|nr:hypothetical protein KR032_005703 [Drosophila birchii]
MEFISALLLLLQIFLNSFSGVKPTNEFCSLAKDNPGYGSQLENSDGPKCSILDGNTSSLWKETMDKTLDAAEAVKSLTKKLLVEVELESELRESMLVVQRQRKQLQHRKMNAAAARELVDRCRKQVMVLTKAVRNAQKELSTRAAVLSETKRKVLNSRHVVDAKKKYIELLTRRVKIARADFENTKMAVEVEARQRQAEMEAKLEKLAEIELENELETEMTYDDDDDDDDVVHIPELPVILV